MVLKDVSDSWKGEFARIGAVWRGTFPEGRSRDGHLSVVESSFISVLLVIRSLSLSRIGYVFQSYRARSTFSELYVVSWFVVLATLVWHPPSSFLAASIIAWYRLIEGMTYRLCIIFVDRYERSWSLRSLNRSLIILLINYAELLLCFALLYATSHSIAWSGSLSTVITQADPMAALYFSAVTGFTLGYGDILPINTLGQFLVVAQLLLSFVFVVLILGVFLTGVNYVKDYSSAGSD